MLVDAGVTSVMGAYNRVNGEPCCGSPTLLADILRGEWGFEGFVCSDCRRHRRHAHAPQGDGRRAESAVLAVTQRLRPGDRPQLPTGAAGSPCGKGLLSEEEIDRCLTRVLTARFRLGMFDDPKSVPYAAIRGDVVQCERHLALAREAAVKSCVLLKNNGVLPLGPKVRTICVGGPNAARRGRAARQLLPQRLRAAGHRAGGHWSGPPPRAPRSPT